MPVQPLAPAFSDEDAAARFIESARHFQQDRQASFTARVSIGSQHLLLTVENGKVAVIEDLSRLRPLTSWDFSLSADTDSWTHFWQTTPVAGWHDIFALSRYGRMRIEGNLHPFMAHLQFVKDLLASPRRAGGLQ